MQIIALYSKTGPYCGMEAILEAALSPLGLASISLAGLVFYLVYRFSISPYRVLSDHGIPGSKPSPFFGHYIAIRRQGLLKFLDENYKKYGLVFGFYVGCQPRIAIADAELLKQIMVKEFDLFPERTVVAGPQLLAKAIGAQPGLIIATGETWRAGRHILTPAFSGMKMKLMVPLLKRSSDILVEKVGEYAESGESAELYKLTSPYCMTAEVNGNLITLMLYGEFTLETLIATAFGRYVAVQKGEANELTKAASIVFQAVEEEPDPVLLLLSHFPWLERVLVWAIGKHPLIGPITFLQNTALGLVQQRIQSHESPKIKDLLQLMVDASVEQDGSKDGKKKLTDKDIVAFSIDFLVAGYETTANTLTYASYLLAMNTDVQEKVQAEIDDYFEENPEASLYEAAQKMEYLDMVIQETMRLYTPIPRTQRLANKTITIGDVTIPEGTEVVVPIALLHHCPYYWPDPYKFDPERFTAEAKASRPQLAHMPFGWGPRNCIGMRFALLEAKIALMEILRKFSFVRGPETKTDLHSSSVITEASKNGVLVKVAVRE